MMGMRDWFTDAMVRHKARLHEVSLDRYTICIARTVEQYEDAFRLVDLAFAYEGIRSVRDVSLRITPQHVLPESTVLVAYEGDTLVGTMTVTLDSAAGLPLDKDYPDELASLRKQGAKIVEYGSLALVRRCWKKSVSTLLSMAAVWLSRNVLDASHIVIGVNPRAIPFYRGLYGFAAMGASQHHTDLDAPVQGMMCPTSHFVDCLKRYFRRPTASGVQLHELFAETLPPCVAIDALGDGEDWARWKMPREVFQELFMCRSNRLRTLDPQARAYLQTVRSPSTLEVNVAQRTSTNFSRELRRSRAVSR
ncbi:MAG: hypothetical protein JRH20_00505 [Deltaproteobacteria bacterium]|nr:hypothetical protein [Deltaproteobacteria bacterium]